MIFLYSIIKLDGKMETKEQKNTIVYTTQSGMWLKLSKQCDKFKLKFYNAYEDCI